MSLFGGKRQKDAKGGKGGENAQSTPAGNASVETAARLGVDKSSAPAKQAVDKTSTKNVSAGSSPAKQSSKQQSRGGEMATIGGTIQFKGELTGDEDLEILGQVDGKIQLPSHQLTIGEGGRVTAEICAKTVLVIGKVTGDITATERLEVQATGVVDGDIRAPRLLVQEGAVVNGAIEMTDRPASHKASPPKVQQPAVASSGLGA